MGEPDSLIFSSAGRQAWLPADRVSMVSTARDAFTIPFGGADFEGLVLLDGGGLAPQIDWTAHWGGASRAGCYRICVDTTRGPVWFRVDAIASPASGVSAKGGSALADMEACVESLTSAGDSGETPSARASREEGAKVFLLIVEARGQRFAIPAEDVSRVERPLSVGRLRDNVHWGRRVELAGGLCPGVCLGLWHQGSETDNGEEVGFALVLADLTQSVALLVGQVVGLFAVSRERIQRLSHGSGDSCWYLDPEHGPVEVIDSGEIPGCESSAGAVRRLVAVDVGRPQAAAVEQAGQHAERRRGLDARRGLSARVGGYSCVFPDRIVLRVAHGIPREGMFTGRRPGCFPVFDLGLLLGVGPVSTASGRVFWVARRGRSPVAILAERLAILDHDLIWYPRAAVPILFDRFCAALGGDGSGQLHWLVRETIFERKSDPDVRRRCRDALRGWIRPVATGAELPG